MESAMQGDGGMKPPEGIANPARLTYHNSISILVCQLQPLRADQSFSTNRGVMQLHSLYCCLDELIASFGCQKIRSTGSGGYMAVAGLCRPMQNHPEAIYRAAAAILQYVQQSRVFMYDVFLGIHTGACASAVIGSANLSFDVYGPTPTTAKLLCHSALPNSIQVSASTFGLLPATGSEQWRFRGEMCMPDGDGVGAWAVFSTPGQRVAQLPLEPLHVRDELDFLLPPASCRHRHGDAVGAAQWLLPMAALWQLPMVRWLTNKPCSSSSDSSSAGEAAATTTSSACCSRSSSCGRRSSSSSTTTSATGVTPADGASWWGVGWDMAFLHHDREAAYAGWCNSRYCRVDLLYVLVVLLITGLALARDRAALLAGPLLPAGLPVLLGAAYCAVIAVSQAAAPQWYAQRRELLSAANHGAMARCACLPGLTAMHGGGLGTGMGLGLAAAAPAAAGSQLAGATHSALACIGALACPLDVPCLGACIQMRFWVYLRYRAASLLAVAAWAAASYATAACTPAMGAMLLLWPLATSVALPCALALATDLLMRRSFLMQLHLAEHAKQA